MSLSAKREPWPAFTARYQRAGRPHKTRILDEFCATCGYHRKAALRLLNRPLPTTPPKRSGPKIIYDPAEVLPVLKALWLASDESGFVNGHALVVDGGLIGGRPWSESQLRRATLMKTLGLA